MTTTGFDSSGRSQPGLFGSLGFLLMNFPLGIFWFVVLITLLAVGVGTAIIWIGVPIAAFAVLFWRGGAQVERARTYALLGAYIPTPYRALPEATQKTRWKFRLSDVATWRDLGYLLVLLPVSIVQFALVVAFWSTSLALAALPIYFRFLPGGAFLFVGDVDHLRWVTIDSTLSALPWAAVGVVLLYLTVRLTTALGAAHARFALALLGPSEVAR